MVFGYSLTTDGTLQEALDATASAIEAVDPVVQEKLREIAGLILQEAKSNLQGNAGAAGAGELLGSLQILNDDGGFTIEIGSSLPYAIYVEYGRGPVHPKSARSLHWVDANSGKDVFVKYSGPAEAHPFMEPAIFKYMPQLGSLLKEINPQEGEG